MDDSFIVTITKSRIEDGFLAVPNQFAVRLFPPHRDVLAVYLGSDTTPSPLPFVPSMPTKEARIYGLKRWFDSEHIHAGDQLLVVALNPSDKVYSARRYDDTSGDDDSLGSDEPFHEGRELLIVHIRKERDRRAVSAKKKQASGRNGSLKCEVCSFDFAEVYGELGEGFAECHHLVPLSQVSGTTETRLRDLALVCANCHRMLHRRPGITVEALRHMVEIRRAG